jgi:nucleotide-binding universal stress UspA family protein
MMTPQEVKTGSARPQRENQLFYTQIALDATPHSRLVIESLHRFLSPGRVHSDFVYVLPMAPTTDRKFSAFDNEAREEIERIVNSDYDEYTRILSEHQLVVENRDFIHDAETVEEGILQHVEDTQPDLLVLGMSPGSPQHKGWRISSTSYAVATHAPCSVLVVKRPVHADRKLKVLFATDGSSQAETAIADLTRFLPQDNTEIMVFSVVSVNAYVLPMVEPYVNYTPLERAMQGEATELMNRTRTAFEKSGYTVSNAWFNLGDPIDQILLEAEKNEIDLIVMGSHGAGGRIASWLLGSVSSRVLEYSKASVAILK